MAKPPVFGASKAGIAKIRFVFAKKWGATPSLIGQAEGAMRTDAPSINRREQPC